MDGPAAGKFIARNRDAAGGGAAVGVGSKQLLFATKAQAVTKALHVP